MDPNVTTLSCTEPRGVSQWVQTHVRRFAMMAMANLRFFIALFTRPPDPTLPASFAVIQCAFVVRSLTRFVPGERGQAIPRFETAPALDN